MTITPLAAFTLAFSTLAVTLPAPALAEHRDHQEWSQSDDEGDGGDHQDEQRQYRRHGDHDRQDYEDHHASRDYGYRCRNDGTAGLVVGALAGGYLGNRVAGRHHRAVGTIIGGTSGALAGRALDRGC